MKPDRKLLRRIAAIPAGERLPIARFARELNSSQSVVITMVQALISDGAIDGRTLRPFELAAEIPPAMVETVRGFDPAMPGREVAALLRDQIARRGLKFSAVSNELFGGTGAINRMESSDRPLRRKTAARVVAWLSGLETPQGEAAPVPGAADEGGSGRSVAVAPAEAPTGADLFRLLEAEADRRGLTVNRFIRPLAINPGPYLANLRKAKRPKPETVARVRALIAGEDVPEPAWKQERARQVDSIHEERGRVEERQQAAETAALARLPGETLADAVRREAVDAGKRRGLARLTGGVHRPVPAEAPDDPDIGHIMAARRAAEDRDLATPSALIRRATREWPDKCAKVAGLAARMGVQLGEAWQRVIDAGVMTVAEDLSEEGI